MKVSILDIIQLPTLKQHYFAEKIGGSNFLESTVSSTLEDNILEIRKLFPFFKDPANISFNDLNAKKLNDIISVHIKFEDSYDSIEGFDTISVIYFESIPISILTQRYEDINSYILNIDLFKEFVSLIYNNYIVEQEEIVLTELFQETSFQDIIDF